MTVLFPAIKPYQTHHWNIDGLHTLYVEESGNPRGLPVLFLHGGPGGGCADYNRQFFDPERYRIIMFDQRGCGKSRPHAELESNTTQDLVADMDEIRKRLGIGQWTLFGGSWGTTLALLYAQQFPQQVSGMILRGVFLARPSDIDWMFQEGASRFFPDEWRAFVSIIDVEDRTKLVAAYHKILAGENEIKAMEAALAWARWEASCSALVPNLENIKNSLTPFSAMSLARLECHYMYNLCFIENNQILKNMSAISHIPAAIVHGRYDMVCPIEQAIALDRQWMESKLTIISDAGHAATEQGSLLALIDASNDMIERIQ